MSIILANSVYKNWTLAYALEQASLELDTFDGIVASYRDALNQKIEKFGGRVNQTEVKLFECARAALERLSDEEKLCRTFHRLSRDRRLSMVAPEASATQRPALREKSTNPVVPACLPAKLAVSPEPESKDKVNEDPVSKNTRLRAPTSGRGEIATGVVTRASHPTQRRVLKPRSSALAWSKDRFGVRKSGASQASLNVPSQAPEASGRSVGGPGVSGGESSTPPIVPSRQTQGAPVQAAEGKGGLACTGKAAEPCLVPSQRKRKGSSEVDSPSKVGRGESEGDVASARQSDIRRRIFAARGITERPVVRKVAKVVAYPGVSVDCALGQYLADGLTRAWAKCWPGQDLVREGRKVAGDVMFELGKVFVGPEALKQKRTQLTMVVMNLKTNPAIASSLKERDGEWTAQKLAKATSADLRSVSQAAFAEKVEAAALARSGW